MPTEIRNTPSSRPLNGSMVTSIWRRNSVSASSSPAISEPSSIGRSDLRGGKTGGEDHQQARGDEQLRAAGARDAAEQRAQHQPAGDDQAEHDQHRLDDGPGERIGAARAEHADDEQHRHRGDVLQQQHRRARRGRPGRPAASRATAPARRRRWTTSTAPARRRRRAPAARRARRRSRRSPRRTARTATGRSRTPGDASRAAVPATAPGRS